MQKCSEIWRIRKEEKNEASLDSEKCRLDRRCLVAIVVQIVKAHSTCG
jgi:hypothetical protein